MRRADTSGTNQSVFVLTLSREVVGLASVRRPFLLMRDRGVVVG